MMTAITKGVPSEIENDLSEGGAEKSVGSNTSNMQKPFNYIPILNTKYLFNHSYLWYNRFQK